MARSVEIPRPEHRTSVDIQAELSARLTDIDAEIESLKSERFRVNAALLAIQGRKRPGRPPATA